MKGKKKFTSKEAAIIRVLLKEKISSTSDRQKTIRDQMRKLCFYISDFTTRFDGFDLKSFEKLISSGRIEISDKKEGYVPNQEFAQINSSASINLKEVIFGGKDEEYVIYLCDKILGVNSLRQHKFDFLTGDPNERGISAKLPIDAYYPSIKLVVEYRERQHTESIKHFDKPDRMTVSGVHRGEQRKIYDERRREILPKYGISLVEISYTDFKYNSQKRIIRNMKADTATLELKLRLFIK